jgi:prepilin-type N-terminal cleavage/methylation domain-containing protein
MQWSKRELQWSALGREGFTLVELLVIIAIIGVIGAFGFSGFFFLVRRARVQSVALEMAGWIENVRNAAADNVSSTRTAGGCAMTFTTATSASAGTQIASVDNACPVSETVLRVPNEVQQDSIAATVTGGPTVIFTPRGVWTTASGGSDAGASAAPGETFTVLISLASGGPSRCIRLSPALGSVEIGRPQGSATACDAGAQWQTL